MKIKPFIQLIRVHNWIKNFFVFAPLLFVGQLFRPEPFVQVLWTFVAFCFVASFVYVVNDIVDRSYDAKHPKKKHRPIASGAVSVTQASLIGAIFLLIGLGIGFLTNPTVGSILFIYIILNIWYSAQLKHLVVIDVMAISLGFVLRIVAGAVVIQASLSPWIIMCGFLLTLFLAISKRRQELILMNAPKTEMEKTREVLDHYSLELLDKMIIIVLSALLLSYFLYTFNDERSSDRMMITVPFVVYGVFRYLYLLHAGKEEDNPIALAASDYPLLVSVGLWVLSVVYILYS